MVGTIIVNSIFFIILCILLVFWLLERRNKKSEDTSPVILEKGGIFVETIEKKENNKMKSEINEVVEIFEMLEKQREYWRGLHIRPYTDIYQNVNGDLLFSLKKMPLCIRYYDGSKNDECSWRGTCPFKEYFNICDTDYRKHCRIKIIDSVIEENIKDKTQEGRENFLDDLFLAIEKYFKTKYLKVLKEYKSSKELDELDEMIARLEA